MPRKEKSVAEVFIAFCMTAEKDEITSLFHTAQTVLATRFPPEPKAKRKVKRARASGPTGVVQTHRPSAGVTDALKHGESPGVEEATKPIPVPLGAAQEAAAAQSPRRRRPPVAPPAPATDITNPAASDDLPPQNEVQED